MQICYTKTKRRKIMNAKRFLSAALAAVQMSLLLAACGDTTPESNPADDTAAVQETTAPAETNPLTEEEKRALVKDDLPEKKFDGREYTVVTMDDTKADYVVDGENAQLLNDSIYARNRTVIERFNVKLGAVTYADRKKCRAAVQQVFKAGDAAAFDIVAYNMVDNSANAVAGMYHNLYDVPYINFDKPWWGESNMDGLTVNGKAFMALGDLSINTVNNVWAHLYNKDMAEDLNIENLYDVVRRGDWTIDYVKTLARTAYKDVNGDGVRNTGDTFGLGIASTSAFNVYLWSFDNPIISKDAGTPVFTLKTDKAASIFTVITELYSDTVGVIPCIGKDYSSTDHKPEFQSSQLLILAGAFKVLANLAGDSDFSIGILPYPKWDTNQEQYATILGGGSDAIGITLLETGENLEFIGIITEALCAESYKQTVPVYFDVMLKSRYADEPDDAEMIQLIMDSRVSDLGYIYDYWKGAAFWLQDLVKAGNSNFVSHYESKWPAAQTYYEKVLAIFK